MCNCKEENSEFECGYINKPYCSLRPFSNIPSCPKFSCPPPLGCHNSCGNPCYPPNNCCPPNCHQPNNWCWNNDNWFPHCCPPHQDFCRPSPCCPPFFDRCRCNPCNPPFDPCCNPCFPDRHPSHPCSCNPLMNNLLWFCGGFRCGNKKGQCQNEIHLDECSRPDFSQRDFLKNFIKNRVD